MTYKLVCGSILKDNKEELEDKLNNAEDDGYVDTGLASVSGDNTHMCILMHR